MASKPGRPMGRDSLGRERRRDLRDRLNEVKNAAWRTVRQPEPPHVTAARKVIAAHERVANRKTAARRDSILGAYGKARRALLSTDSFDEGLSIVDNLERLARRRGWLAKEPTDGE